MLKIYGADLSAPANKVRMTANALGIEYQYIRISIKAGENRTEEYLKMHPAGRSFLDSHENSSCSIQGNK